MRDHDGRWTPFVIQLHLGPKEWTRRGPIVTNGLVMFDSITPASDLGSAEALVRFLQSWRNFVPRAVSEGVFPQTVQIQRQPSENDLPPCWCFSLYENISDPPQGIVPRGPFPNSAASFRAVSPGDAAAQWLEDETFSEFSSPYSAIECKIWDSRAFFTDVKIRKGTVTVQIAHVPNLQLECTALFRIGRKSVDHTKPVGEVETICFGVPERAERCTLLLVGVNDFTYDQRQLWLGPEPALDSQSPPIKNPVSVQLDVTPRGHFVDLGRLEELRQLKHSHFDLRRLIRLCEELNESWEAGSLFAVAALTRAVLDHVPLLLGKTVFSDVVQSSSRRSFRDSMRHLNESARKIADGHLHSPVRKKEVLPTRTQVDFSRDLDVLLAEIIATAD